MKNSLEIIKSFEKKFILMKQLLVWFPSHSILKIQDSNRVFIEKATI